MYTHIPVDVTAMVDLVDLPSLVRPHCLSLNLMQSILKVKENSNGDYMTLVTAVFGL